METLNQAAERLQTVYDALRADGFRIYGRSDGTLFVAPWDSIEHRAIGDPHLNPVIAPRSTR